MNIKARAFLAAFSACGHVTKAAESAGIEKTIHYRWLKQPAYAAAFMAAMETAGSLLSREAAMKGKTVDQARALKREQITTAGYLPAQRHVALVRDDFACRICQFSVAVNTHHIVSRKDGGPNFAGNLITLCPNHHAMAHLGLLSKEQLVAFLVVAVPVSLVNRPKAPNLVKRVLYRLKCGGCGSCGYCRRRSALS
jgi:hypothetical protein